MFVVINGKKRCLWRHHRREMKPVTGGYSVREMEAIEGHYVSVNRDVN